MKDNSLFKNSIFFVLYKFLDVVFPLITATYVSRVILSSGVGKVASAQNIVQYFVLIAALGIPNYGIREVAKSKDSVTSTSLLFSELFTINSISTLICTLVYYSALYLTGFNKDEYLLYSIVGLAIPINFFNVDWFYQGYEKYSYIAFRSFFIKIISLVAIFLLVKEPSSYVVYSAIYVFGIAGNHIINFINLKKFNIQLDFKGTKIERHWKPVFIMLCTTIAIELYTMVDITMLTVFCSDEVVGYYTNSMRIVKIVIALVAAVGGVLLPRLSYYYTRGALEECEIVVNRVFRILFYLIIPSCIGLYFTADALMPVMFGTSFINAIPTLKIASFLIVSLGFSNLFGTQVLLTFSEEKKLLYATIIGAVSNIVINSILIPKFQQNGAAIASIISEALVTVITFSFARGHLKIKLSVQFIIKTFVAAIGMSFIVAYLKFFVHNQICYLLVAIILGAATYFLISLIINNEIIQEVKLLIIKKGRIN